MNKIESEAAKLFSVLALAREELEKLMEQCKALANVSEVTESSEIRRYPDKTIFEFFVEAELHSSGDAVCWWLDLILCGDDWIVDRKIHLTVRGEQDVLEQYPEIKFPNAGGVADALLGLTQELTTNKPALDRLR
jgi:hypothetical protein